MELVELKALIAEEAGPAITLALDALKGELPGMIKAAIEAETKAKTDLSALSPEGKKTMTLAAFNALPIAEQRELARKRAVIIED